MTDSDVLSYIAALPYAAAKALLDHANADFGARPTFWQPEFVVPPMGHALWAVQNFADDWRDHTVAWTFTAPSGKSVQRRGRVASVIAGEMGVWTVQQTIDAVVVRSFQQKVTPPMRTTMSVPGPGGVVAGISSNLTINFDTPGDYVLPSFKGLVNIVINLSPGVRIVGPAAKNIFDTDARCQFISVFGTAGSDVNLLDPRAKSGDDATAIFGALHGSNWTFVNVNVGPIQRGPAVQGVKYLYLENFTTLNGTSTQSQAIYIDDLQFGQVLNSDFRGSIKESSVRCTIGSATGESGMRDTTWDTVTGRMQPGSGKASFTSRCGRDNWWVDCTADQQNFSFDSGGASGGAKTAMRHCLVTNLTTRNGKPEVKPGAVDVRFEGGSFNAPSGTECVSVQQQPASVGMVSVESPRVVASFKNCRAYGDKAGLKVYPAAGAFLPNELSVNGFVFFALDPAKAVLAKADDGPVDLNKYGVGNLMQKA